MSNTKKAIPSGIEIQRAIWRSEILALDEKSLTFKLHRVIEVVRAAATKGGFGSFIMFNAACVPTLSAERACFSIPVSKLRKTPTDMAWILGHLQGTYPNHYAG